ncbi:hypothetical protein DY000_02059529 [Brassica cretica]|uniref:DUF223 domain-containing protein n=1 Tax=Brassica cretica TaxID=69181 RepID=A0ABQ7AZ18_BRACR|nr:hypothetical protein DY000_02059529 [Brassica cretica]
MGIFQLYISDLETGRFEDVVVTRLLQFWESSTLIRGTITSHQLSVFYIARSNSHFKLCASPVCIRFTEHTSFVEVNHCVSVCLIRLRDKLVLLDVEIKDRLVLNVTLGTQFYFYHESQATQYAGSAEQRVVPLVYLPKYGGVKKLESVKLSELNIYVLNSPLQHPISDDMSVAVKLSMVPNPVVKSSCSYHTNGPDDVPIIEGCPASTVSEPAHTDSVLTSTETPIDVEKAPSSK